MKGVGLIIIAPNKLLQLLWAAVFLTSICVTTLCLFFIIQSNLGLTFQLVLTVLLSPLIYLFIRGFCYVLSFKVTSSQIGLTIGNSPTFSWSDIDKIQASKFTGKHAGINIHFKKNIYSELPIWQRPLGSKKAYIRSYRTGNFYFIESAQIIKQIMQGKRNSC